jgi:hypothetical protein
MKVVTALRKSARRRSRERESERERERESEKAFGSICVLVSFITM